MEEEMKEGGLTAAIGVALYGSVGGNEKMMGELMLVEKLRCR
jgi:hypothetical protein